jgi:hypothetical protein
MEQTTTNAGSDADNEETYNEELKETTSYADNVLEPEEAAIFFQMRKSWTVWTGTYSILLVSL